jgi:hypothetical protein
MLDIYADPKKRRRLERFLKTVRGLHRHYTIDLLKLIRDKRL